MQVIVIVSNPSTPTPVPTTAVNIGILVAVKGKNSASTGKLGTSIDIGGTLYHTAASEVSFTTSLVLNNYIYTTNPKSGKAWTYADLLGGAGGNSITGAGVHVVITPGTTAIVDWAYVSYIYDLATATPIPP